jgi:hypothetical protein
LAGEKMVRWIIACMEALVKLEALSNLDHGCSPARMQHYLGGQDAKRTFGQPIS